MGAWSDGLEQHCLEPVLYVIYTYNLSEGAIRLIGFILADARFFFHNLEMQSIHNADSHILTKKP